APRRWEREAMGPLAAVKDEEEGVVASAPPGKIGIDRATVEQEAERKRGVGAPVVAGHRASARVDPLDLVRLARKAPAREDRMRAPEGDEAAHGGEEAAVARVERPVVPAGQIGRAH